MLSGSTLSAHFTYLMPYNCGFVPLTKVQCCYMAVVLQLSLICEQLLNGIADEEIELSHTRSKSHEEVDCFVFTLREL